MNKAGEAAHGFRAGASGFSLIETVIALAVIAVTFIGLIGLLGLGVVNDQTSTQQTIATNIASSILADLRSTPGNTFSGGTYQIASSSRYSLTLPTAITSTPLTPLSGVTTKTLYFDNSPVTVATAASASYKATVYTALISQVGPGVNQTGQSQYSVVARVVVSWPAAASTVPTGSVDIISQFLLR